MTQSKRGIHIKQTSRSFTSFFKHIHPVKIPLKALELKSTWALDGICLLTLVLVSCFTGYLLPWDQTAFWAVTICINMFDYIPAGSFFKAFLTSGNEVSEKTLRLFFTCHTTLMPAALKCMKWHIPWVFYWWKPNNMTQRLCISKKRRTAFRVGQESVSQRQPILVHPHRYQKSFCLPHNLWQHIAKYS